MNRFVLRSVVWAALACASVWAGQAPALAKDCTRTTVGLIPLNDLGAGQYLGRFQGGLYPEGQNVPPADHAAVGRARALEVRPLDGEGNPDPNGRYVLLSIGMSNTTQEFQTFMAKARLDPHVNSTTLAIVDGARGGQSADLWDSPDEENYDRIRDHVLAPRGLTEAQVQVVWVKVANKGPTVSLPGENADAYRLVVQQGDISRALRVRYPNVKLVFFSSRIYAGYADTALNPEPYAYESGFGVKWLIEAQIRQMSGGPIDDRAGDMNYDTVAPWAAWAAYLWADGLAGRSDGLIWECDDFADDGTHPSISGREKVADMLLRFFKSSEFSRPWFVDEDGRCLADINGDGRVDQRDLALLLSEYGCARNCRADIDHDGDVDQADLAQLLSEFGRICD